MVDLIVPTARVVDLYVMAEEQVPFDMKGQLAGALRGINQAREFAHALGRASKPTKPLMLFGPDDHVPILIIGNGVTEAAEMQDRAEEALGKQEENMRKYGRAIDFDDARERRGMARREDFGRLASDAFAQRAEQLRRNPVTKGRD